jgi:hypothetical protein
MCKSARSKNPHPIQSERFDWMKKFDCSQGPPSAPIGTPLETECPICLQSITAINPWGPTRVLIRSSTMICCRNTRISASIAARGRNRSTTIPKIWLKRSNIPQSIIRFCVPRQLDRIYDRDNPEELLQRRVRHGPQRVHSSTAAEHGAGCPASP